MTSVAKCLAAAILAAFSIAGARADSSARVIETYPSAGSVLGRHDTVWAHIEYASDEPISLWARPFRKGAQVTNAMSNPSLAYAGAGRAVGWFALVEPGQVDEVRIIAGGGALLCIAALRVARRFMRVADAGVGP